MEKKGVNYLLLVVLCAAMFLENKESVHAAGAENIAYGKSVWVSSSESGSYGGNKAVDADGNTRWASTYSDNQNIIVDLGQKRRISKVRIDWEAAYAKQFQIQVSNDNTSWTTVYENYNAS
ncbi:MAG: discoidin domain-containing protein, partial [Pseudobutyrivibrio sp.]|nr:discoidin domain-containing protein [Pseudobutyrivibrio sp.]